MKIRNLILVVFIVLFVIIFVSSRIFDFSPLSTIGNQLMSTIMGKPVCNDCNVILISLDTLSANHLPCYGYERNTAPNLCKFGKDNITFANMFSNSSYTLPSHVSLFTGLYPNEHKVTIPSVDRLSLSTPFLPSILQDNGYKNYFMMNSFDPQMPLDLVYNRGIDQINDSYRPADWKKGINTILENNKIGQKTFLFLHTYFVHEPYIPGENEKITYANSDDKLIYPKIKLEAVCNTDFLTYLKSALENDLELTNMVYYKEYKDLYDKFVTLFEQKNELQFCKVVKDEKLLYPYYFGYYSYRANSNIDENNRKNISSLVNLYDSRIVELDKQISDIFSYIKSSSLKNNTIIVITADHGEEFMEHGALRHGTNLYDTSVKVPLMMYIPGQKNRIINDIAQSVDIVPTLLNILKIPHPKKLSGSDLFITNIFNAQKYVSAQLNRNDSTIRDSQWKLFFTMRNGKPVGTQLFKWTEDPQEKNNVIFTNSNVVERLLMNIKK